MTLEIPEFLIVTPEAAARRKAYNDTHPVAAPTTFLAPAKELEPEAQRIVDERAAREKAQSYSRIADMKSKRTARDAREAGMEWRDGKYVEPNAMSRANYDRILRELPTEKHRQIFRQDYGSKFEKQGKRK